MKKIISLLIAAMLCLSMGGCGVKKEEHPLALFEGNKLVAELGMTKDEIIKNFGEGTENYRFLRYDGIDFFFRGENVVLITTTNEQYSDYLGVSPGAQAEDEIIYLDKDLKVIDDSVEKKGDQCKYMLKHTIEDEGSDKIKYITITDYIAYYNGK